MVGIAFNTELQRAYFYFGGRWVNGRPDDPKAGTWIEKSDAYVLYAASAAPPHRYLGSNSWTFNFGASAFVHRIPPGYRPWGGRRGAR